MPWMYFAIISVVTVSIAMLLERVLMRDKESDPVSYAIVFQMALGLISLIFAFVFGRFILPTDLSMLPRFLISSLLWAGATVFSFNALKRISAGEATIIGTIGTVISVVLGIVFLREHLELESVVGIGLILAAVWLVSTSKSSTGSRKGLLFAFLSALCGSVTVINDAVILKTYEAFSYTTIMSFLPGFVLLGLFPRRIRNVSKLLNIKSIGFVSVFCVFYSIQAIAYYLAFENEAPVSQLSPIIKSSVVLTVVLGAVFLKERDGLLKKTIAALVVTIGAILVE